MSRGVWSKRGKTQWVEETEPSLVPCARPLAWFRRNAPTSLVTRDGHVSPGLGSVLGVPEYLTKVED